LGPLNLSVKGEYALLAILDLALQRAGEPIKIASIAKRQRIPQKFLELILASLKQGGFVESRRGAEGGYLLAKAAHEITVGDVLRYISVGRRKMGGRSAQSPLDDMWTEVQTAVSAILDRRTFADLARSWNERQHKYVPNWEI